MEQTYQKITPEKLFITILKQEEQKWKQEEGLYQKNHTSGNECMDKLAELVSLYGMQPTKFYEKMLKLKQGVLHHIVFSYSGLSFIDWRNNYLMLASKELLSDTNYPIDVIAKRLKFSGITTFSKWFIRLEKQFPSKWRKSAKLKLKNKEKELLLMAKKDTQKPSL